MNHDIQQNTYSTRAPPTDAIYALPTFVDNDSHHINALNSVIEGLNFFS